MSEVSEAIQAKCLAFGDRIIKLNDYLLAQAVAAHENYKKSKIAGLRSFLGKTNQDNLLTVEVICEGVPSPLYVRKWDKHLRKCYGCGIANIDYRYTGKAFPANVNFRITA